MKWSITKIYAKMEGRQGAIKINRHLKVIHENEYNYVRVTMYAWKTGINPSRPMHFRKLYQNKNNLKFYFRTCLWCLERFYKGLKDLHKTFRGTRKECEKKLILVNFFFSFEIKTWRGKLNYAYNSMWKVDRIEVPDFKTLLPDLQNFHTRLLLLDSLSLFPHLSLL